MQELLSKKSEESSAHKDSELTYQNAVEETKKLLEEKCAIIEIMKKEHEIESENWQTELRQLQQDTERQKNEEKKNLLLEYQSKMREKIEVVKKEAEKLRAETLKSSAGYAENVEKLKNESLGRMEQMSAAFEGELRSKGEELTKLKSQLEKRDSRCEDLLRQLSDAKNACKTKDVAELQTLDEIEGKGFSASIHR